MAIIYATCTNVLQENSGHQHGQQFACYTQNSEKSPQFPLHQITGSRFTCLINIHKFARRQTKHTLLTAMLCSSVVKHYSFQTWYGGRLVTYVRICQKLDFENWSNVCIITSIATCMHALKVGIIHWWQNPLTLGTAPWWSPASQRALQMSLGPTNRRNEGGGALSKAAHTNAVQGAYIRTHYMLCKCRYCARCVHMYTLHVVQV